MTQEDKELLLKDLCARLPYGVKVQYRNKIFCVEHVSPMYEEVKLDTCETWTVDASDVKPYLLPVSSMTEKQRLEFRKIMDIVEAKFVNACCKGGFTLSFTGLDDWLNKNHIDYRGLIGKGLAINAIGMDIY